MENAVHILLIDDDATIRRLFGAKLASVGFEVLYAGSGEEGRETARRLKPDIILLDIRMPGTDGIKTAERLREEEQTKQIPIVFLTNEDLSLEAEKAMKELWVADYIHKSIDLDEFVKRVEKIIKEQGINPAINSPER
ncbi:MAG: hypothetical protein A3C07_00465 [Candidatus Sungbacteria bacterium RIFCSPHIGHO2_02_FULL_47_11]|uniref:Response regulatory domain-containing protein n=1 Tax=Candidatus Sungbacteria bacterium RIFCSPHIGHO2_02_FULL_47_11 TaxID=1802270 RepID=A0A1G2KJ27_9BACT|nr:MAG: hypothetical protein A3C07_00465 [Candidatus Sungbacteria bacterium RIFCSPHIGHO2_02_FULL_47_11]